MTDKAITIPEIRASYDQESARRLSEWHSTVDEIASEHEPEENELLEYMSPAQRGEVLLDQMEARIERERAARIEEAAAALDAFEEKHEMRLAWLDLCLYHVEGADQIVASAVMASDEQLVRMLDAAIRTTSLDLGKVVFAEAQSRNLPELMERYFTEMDPEARELLEERRQALSPGSFERKRADIETMFSKPERASLVVRARVGS
jgi:hypothetical protein